MMDFLTKEEQNKLTPEKRIINSLKWGKFQGGGQGLYGLIKSGYMTYDYHSKRATQRILQKLKKKSLVMYFRETKVWYWIGEDDE